MKARGVSIGLAVLFVSAICLSGCSKKDDKPAETKAPVTRRAAAETSTLIEQFLDRRVRMRSIAAGDPIKSFFARWEDILHHRPPDPRQPVPGLQPDLDDRRTQHHPHHREDAVNAAQ